MIADLLSSLQSFSDPDRIAFAQRTFPTKLQVIGVTNPNLRLVLRALKSELKKADSASIIAFADTLIREQVFELQWLAYELIGSRKKTLRALTVADIDRMNVRLDNWVLTDTFAANILGFAWQEGLLDDAYFLGLQASSDLWQRRLAVVSTTALNIPANGGQGATQPTLLLCRGAIDDHHPMITKAVSWALRTLIKWDRPAVVAFLEEHQDRLAKLVIREVNRKLDTGKKG